MLATQRCGGGRDEGAYQQGQETVNRNGGCGFAGSVRSLTEFYFVSLNLRNGVIDPFGCLLH
ncbi:MAG: hypothetical protein Dbin4_02808 [Alphaproteobacteria bacterium]|nr:hypothetical protein [Alphaproteobacteria bacterium]